MNHLQVASQSADVKKGVAQPGSQRKCACGKSAEHGVCKACRAGHDLGPQLSAWQSTLRRSTAPPIVHEVLRSPGRHLDAATRAAMEPRFGRDFSQVRVHTDRRAAQSADAVAARAYTVGNQIAFAANQFAPHSSEGRRLLAHELAHVVQQRQLAGLPNQIPIGATDTAWERQAQSVAGAPANTSAQRAPTLSEAPHSELQRTPAAAGAVAVRAALLGACAYKTYRYTLDHYSGSQGYNDKFMHCYASCKVASHCGSAVPGLGVPSLTSTLFSGGLGILKEIVDYIKDHLGIGTPADASWEDWFADNYGLASAFKLLTPCEESCRQAPGAVSPKK